MKNGFLYRYFKGTEEIEQLCLPSSLRPLVLKTAHDSPLSGHQVVKKTLNRIQKNFFWYSVHKDVKTFVSACHICQSTPYKGRVKEAPIQEMPKVMKPFEKISIDLIGPILPATPRGNRFILTVIDTATRWAEAIPLKHTTTEHVAEALFSTFSRLGFPDEIVSDHGPQFVSEMMKEIYRLCAYQTC